MTLFIIIRIIYEAYFRFPHFKIVKAGMKKWVRRNSEPLITFHLELKTKKASSELVFEELWIDDKRYKYQLSRQDRKFACSFGEKETLKLNILSEIKDHSSNESPMMKGGILLGYTFRNKKKYIRVKKIKEMDQMKLCRE